jgi:hypothetical protein
MAGGAVAYQFHLGENTKMAGGVWLSVVAYHAAKIMQRIGESLAVCSGVSSSQWLKLNLAESS